MQNFEFRLTPAYCLYNGAAVVEQNGSYIKFITESENDFVLRRRLESAFENHLSYIRRQKNCSEEFHRMSRVEFITGSHEEVRNYISLLYHEDKFTNQNGNSVCTEEKKEAAAIILLDSILSEARKRNVTDIHIESNYIRMREKGRLIDYASVQSDRGAELVSRIKLLAGMNVLEKRKSQDGHFVFGEKDPVFVRVSVVGIVGETPDDTDESVVMRLLDTKRLPLGLHNLGFSDRQLIGLDYLLEHKNGIILVCGATGSGKSTTAASLLLKRIKNNGKTEKIISLEDPPEYIIPGVTQIKIGGNSEMSYEKALENVFRQDPDVIMIGEIRNKESAQVAVRAAMTGHLVLATLHTSSVAASVFRLLDLGISPQILSSVIRGIIMQELMHDEEGVSLLGDVALVEDNLGKVLSDCPDEKLIEDSFTHITNVPDLIARTGRRLKNNSFSAWQKSKAV